MTRAGWMMVDLMPELEPVPCEQFREKMIERGEDIIHLVETSRDEECSVMSCPQTGTVTATIMVVSSESLIAFLKRASHHWWRPFVLPILAVRHSWMAGLQNYAASSRGHPGPRGDVRWRQPGPMSGTGLAHQLLVLTTAWNCHQPD
jgi:hypothetical protein